MINGLKSNHFEVGTYVVINNRRAEVVDRPGQGMMKVRYDDATVGYVRPFALQHERKSNVTAHATY